MSFADLTHRDFNDRLAEGAPTPGGGAAAALTGAMAAAAVEMVCNVTIGKAGYE
ncbi:MAG: cyclodeaminase/cyclohydrolase family protein, partial [Halobacteriota archaeon]